MANSDKTLTLLQPESLATLVSEVQQLIRTQLWAKILLALFLGTVTGVVLSPDTDLVPPAIATAVGTWLAFPGQLFLGLIQMVVLPLIVASIICGIAAGEDIAQLKKLGVRMAVFVVATTSMAAGLGIALTMFFKPGNTVDTGSAVDDTPVAAAGDPVRLSVSPDTLIELLPQNPLASMVSGEMLPIVLFSLIVGVAILGVEASQAQQLIRLLEAVQSVCMRIIGWAMLLAPVAVFGLMANVGTTVGFQALAGMAFYVGVVTLGFLLMVLVYVGMAAVGGRRSPLGFVRDLREVQLLAFSTSSSAAVMPLSMQTAQDKLGVSASTAQFLIPLGVTVNMSGSALSMSAATVFLAQVYAVDLPLPTLILIVATAVGASIGSPGVPGVGMGILAMILTSAGIPTAGIPLVLGVDRIVDMMRTVVNVTGDLTACVLFDTGSEASLATPQEGVEPVSAG